VKIIPWNFFITLFRLRSVTAVKGGPTGFPNNEDGDSKNRNVFQKIQFVCRLPVSLSRQPDPVIKARVRNSGESSNPMKILLSRRRAFHFGPIPGTDARDPFSSDSHHAGERVPVFPDFW